MPSWHYHSLLRVLPPGERLAHPSRGLWAIFQLHRMFLQIFHPLRTPWRLPFYHTLPPFRDANTARCPSCPGQSDLSRTRLSRFQNTQLGFYQKTLHRHSAGVQQSLFYPLPSYRPQGRDDQTLLPSHGLVHSNYRRSDDRGDRRHDF